MITRARLGGAHCSACLVLCVGLLAAACGDSSESAPTSTIASGTTPETLTRSTARTADDLDHPRAAMVLTVDDLEDAGLVNDWELLYVEPFDPDPAIERWDGAPCRFPNSLRQQGISTEIAGAGGVDPRIVQIILEGDEVDDWIASFETLDDCPEGPYYGATDMTVSGANASVVLEPDGTDSDGVSYAGAVGTADGLAVVVVVFADTPSDPALDPGVVSRLVATTLARSR